MPRGQLNVLPLGLTQLSADAVLVLVELLALLVRRFVSPDRQCPERRSLLAEHPVPHPSSQSTRQQPPSTSVGVTNTVQSVAWPYRRANQYKSSIKLEMAYRYFCANLNGLPACVAAQRAVALVCSQRPLPPGWLPRPLAPGAYWKRSSRVQAATGFSARYVLP